MEEIKYSSESVVVKLGLRIADAEVQLAKQKSINEALMKKIEELKSDKDAE